MKESDIVLKFREAVQKILEQGRVRTIREISQEVGVAEATIRNYLKGRSEPKLSFITGFVKKYAQEIGTELSEFVVASSRDNEKEEQKLNKGGLLGEILELTPFMKEQGVSEFEYKEVLVKFHKENEIIPLPLEKLMKQAETQEDMRFYHE